MPAFIKSEKDEKVWSRAKSLVHKQYPDISEDSDNFWKLANSVYHKIRKGAGVQKSASENVFRAMIKIAGDKYYTIKRGDTFSGLDKRLGYTLGSFQKANPEVNPKRLRIGGRLKFPKKAISVNPPPPSPIPEPELPVIPTAQSAGSAVTHKFKTMYDAIAHAETGSFKDKWIRTKGVPGSSSTAWGPVQLTGGTIADFMGRYPRELSKHRTFYTRTLAPMYANFSKYGREPNIPGYDKRWEYGGYGVRLSDDQKRQYRELAMDIMQLMSGEIERRNPKASPATLRHKFIQRWRGEPYSADPAYYDKVNSFYNK